MDYLNRKAYRQAGMGSGRYGCRCCRFRFQKLESKKTTLQLGTQKLRKVAGICAAGLTRERGAGEEMGGEAQVTAGQEGVAGCESGTGEKAAGHLADREEMATKRFGEVGVRRGGRTEKQTVTPLLF